MTARVTATAREVTATEAYEETAREAHEETAREAHEETAFVVCKSIVCVNIDRYVRCTTSCADTK